LKLILKKAETSVSVIVFIQDSSSTTGAGLTGLLWNSANLVASYVRPGAARQVLTLKTVAIDAAFDAGGFIEIDSTNMPGVYRLDIIDAVLAAGVDSAVVMLKGATNMAPLLLEIQLTDFDLNSANIAKLDSILGGTGIADDVDLQMRSLTITNDAGIGLDVSGTVSGAQVVGSSGNGLRLDGQGTAGAGLYATGTTTGDGIDARGGATGSGISGRGGADGGAGIKGVAQTNDDGMTLTGAGTGTDLNADITGDLIGSVTGDVTPVAGAEVDITKIHGSAITESTASNLATNFSTFYDNADAATAQTVDDVGGGAGSSNAESVKQAGYLGDFELGDTVQFAFSTTDTLGAAPTVNVYKDDNDTKLVTASVTLDVNMGDPAETNVHQVAIVLLDADYDSQADYSVVLSAATIGSDTVSAIIATFSIQNRYQEPVQRYTAK